MEMREIKFRIWDADNNEMLGTFDLTQNPIYWADKMRDGVLMQYTGLKDVNGVEIYEGDIVKGYYDEYNSFFDEVNRHEFISEVKYIDNSFKVHRNTLNDEGRIRDYGYVHEWDSELVEVIGNIYENKNLLEEK